MAEREVHHNFSPVLAAERYADLFFKRDDDSDSWKIVRDAWLMGWDEHRILYPEM